MAVRLEYSKQYLHLKGKTGIYKIKNKVNGKLYVGSTANKEGFLKRFCEHFRSLLKNTHTNKHLQSAFNLYGMSNFEFLVVEECLRDQCLERENFYLKTLKPEYNILLNATSPGLGRNGRLNGISKPVHCINDGMFFESCTLASEHYDLPRSHICSVCRGKASHVKGYCFCFEGDSKRKGELTAYLSSINYMKNHKSKPVYCINTGKTYANSMDAAKDLSTPTKDVKSRNIRQCVEGSRKSHYGYRFCRPSNIQQL